MPTLRRLLPLLLSLAICAIAATVLWRQLAAMDPAEIWRQFRGYAPQQSALALLFVAGALALAALHEVLMARVVARYSGAALRPAAVALVANPIGHAVGFAVISGGAMRLRLYTALGLERRVIAALVVLSAFPYALGILICMSAAALLAPETVAAALHLPATPVRLLGMAGIAAALLFLALSAVRTRIVSGALRRLPLPPPRLALAQPVIGVFEVLLIAGALYVFLPPLAGGFAAFLPAYLIAIVAGQLSGVPAGLGVLEGSLLLLLPALPVDALIGAVLAYRVVVEVVPLAVSLLLWPAMELWPAKPVPLLST